MNLIKRGGVCLYYKCSVALGLIDVYYLQECLIFEIFIARKSCNFISLYLSPSQSSDYFEEFADNLQLSLDKISNQNPFLTVVSGKSSNWYKHDQATHESSKINAVISQFGLQQLIKEKTHTLENSSSCIDLIFTCHPSLVMEKSDAFQCYLHINKGPKLFNRVEYLQHELSLIKASKESVIRVSRKE